MAEANHPAGTAAQSSVITGLSASHMPVRAPTQEAHQKEEAHCAACPKLCRHTCPVADAEKRETVTPWGLMNALHFEDGRSPASFDPTEVDELAYHCTSCRACQRFCHFHQDVPGALHARRAQAFERGTTPERARTLAKRFEAQGQNLYGPRLLERVEAQLPAHRCKPDAREVIWVDCVTVARYPELISDLVTLVDALDRPDIGFYVDEPGCCGLPLYDAGDLAGFRAHAERVMGAMGRHDKVYHLSFGCTVALRDVYAQLGLPEGPLFLSFWDLLHPKRVDLTYALREKRIRWSGPTNGPKEKWVYVPPCQQEQAVSHSGETEAWLQLMQEARMMQEARIMQEARNSGVEARALPSAPGSVELRLATDVGARTPCSGAGGSLPAILPEVAKQVTQRCVAQFAPAEDETVVVGCSSSQRRLSGSTPGPVVQVIHLLADFIRQLEA